MSTTQASHLLRTIARTFLPLPSTSLNVPSNPPPPGPPSLLTQPAPSSQSPFTLQQTRNLALLTLDHLIHHSVLRDEDLVVLLGQPKREILPSIALLQRERLVSVGKRSEIRVGQNKAYSKEYYFVDYHGAVDAVKLRLIRLVKRVEGAYESGKNGANGLGGGKGGAKGQKKEWACERCKAEYDGIEVMGLGVGEHGFECSRCGGVLEQNREVLRDMGEHKRISRVNEQVRPLMRLIEEVDQTRVLENGFEEAWERRVEVTRGVGGELVVGDHGRVMGVSGRDGIGGYGVGQGVVKVQETVKAENVDVRIKDEEDRERDDGEEKRRRQAEMAAKNVLPSWHVGGKIDRNGLGVLGDGGVEAEDLSMDIKDEEDSKQAVVLTTRESKVQDDLERYMAEMEAEEEARRLREAVKEEDEDEDDFEDVEAETSAGGSSQSGTSSGQKRTHDTANGIEGMNGDNASKKIKVADAKIKDDGEESDEDEDDFEDV